MRMLNSRTTPTSPRSTNVSGKPPSDKADRAMCGRAVGPRIVSSNVSHHQSPTVMSLRSMKGFGKPPNGKIAIGIPHPTVGLIVESVMSQRIPVPSIAPSKQLVKPSIA
jgi:hypothetical protein